MQYSSVVVDRVADEASAADGAVKVGRTVKSPPLSGDEKRLDAILQAMSPNDRKAMFDSVGKDLARVAGAQALASMLRKSKLSGREIDARFGYDHAALSRTANGKSTSGPTLWRLFALAEALGFDIEMKISARK